MAASIDRQKTHIPSELRINLPPNVEDLPEALFLLHRTLEQMYCALPSPQLRNVLVFTEVMDGKGDIAAAAKVIALVQRLFPEAKIDWVLTQGGYCDAPQFLKMAKNVTVRDPRMSAETSEAADFLIVGPVKSYNSKEMIASGVGREITGPLFSFMENAAAPCPFYPRALRPEIETLHAQLFPAALDAEIGQLPMGLLLGTGVFLDSDRLEASLGQAEYVSRMEDVSLRADLSGDISLNFGYAHKQQSWEKFIDCAALQEREKDVVIVLNQKGEYGQYSDAMFAQAIFTPARLEQLVRLGYGTICLRGKEGELKQLHQAGALRSLTVVVRPFFIPEDVKCLQLASERLMATGDNSAVEAWCAWREGKNLYVYENRKEKFFQQQVELARRFSPSLAKLLQTFGEERSSAQAMHSLLADPNLPRATTEFCRHITTLHSFEEVAEAAMKRILFHHRLPHLAHLEAEGLGGGFASRLISYLRSPSAGGVMVVAGLSEMEEKIREACLSLK